MPIYEYECNECGNVFEEIVFGSEESVTCPKCKCGSVKKLMSAPSAIDSANGLMSSLGSASNAGGSCGSGGFS